MQKSMIDKELKVLGNALSELLPSMNKVNREKVAKVLKHSERTIYRYLSGEVADVTTAKKILAACNKNIEAREAELKAIA